MEDAGVQRVLAAINQCFAFRIPPQVSAAGHRADSWPKDPAWAGRMVIQAIGERASIELRDRETGNLFAACPVVKDGPPAVQKVVDSSRYFVLRVVDDKTGRHAFIGIAFENRSDAFDFNVAIDDFLKELTREQRAAEDSIRSPTATQDFSFKEGETIKIKLNTKPKKSKEDASQLSDPFGFGTSQQSEGTFPAENHSTSDWVTF